MALDNGATALSGRERSAKPGFSFAGRALELSGDPAPVRTIARFSTILAEGRDENGKARSIRGISQLLSISNLENQPRITRPYEQSGWVHACLKPIGQAIGSTPLEIWVGDPRVDKGATLLPPTDPLSLLLQNPNPINTHAQFNEAGAFARKLDGEEFWMMLTAEGAPIIADARGSIELPTHLVSVRGRDVGLKLNALGWPEQWSIPMASGRSVIVPNGSIVHFRDYDPDNPLRGIGDCEAALSDIDLEWQATRYQRAIIKHSGDPGGTVIMEGATLGPDEQASAETELNEAFRVQNAGRWRLVTGRNIKYEQNKLGPKDMDFAKLLAWIRDKLTAIFGVPPPIVGIMEYATLANFRESVRLFWMGGNGILSYLGSREDVITNQFLRRLRRPDAPRLFARHNTKHVEALQEDKNLQYDIAVKIAQADIGVSFEEALMLVGINVESGALPMAGVRLVSTTSVPLENVLAGDTLPSASAPAPAADTPKAGKAAEVPAEAQAIAPVAAVAPETKDDPPPPPDPVEERRAYWEKRDAQVFAAGEVKLKRAYKGWRRAYEAAQFKRLRDFADEGPNGVRFVVGGQTKAEERSTISPGNVHPDDIEILLLNQADWAKRMATRFSDPLAGIFAASLEDIAGELDVLPIEASSPQVLAFLETQIIKLTEGHASVMADRVREALIEGLNKATSTGELQTLVAEVLPDLNDRLRGVFADRQNRAQTIARTETAKAANGARYMEMKHEGIADSEWITSRDEAVRGTPGGPYADAPFSHYELDGKVAPVGGEFDSSGHPGLKWPGDPDGKAGDVINCRCVAKPRAQPQGQE